MKGVGRKSSDTNGDRKGYPSSRVAWSTLAVLAVTYMFSFMDRQILVLLIDPIKTDLQITDTQVSLLAGMAFAIVYTIACIPMGRIADLWVRKYVIIGGVTVWSLLTISCGFARNFTQMFLSRMGVGLGEASLTPTAYALIPDLFPPQKLARGMSVFALGGLIGGGVSLVLGGVIIGLVNDIDVISMPWVGQIKAWQMVLFTAGALTLLMVIPLSLMPEPKRHSVQETLTEEGDALAAGSAEHRAFKAVLAYLWRYKSFYGFFIAGIAINNLFAFGFGTWVPTYFIRIHGWDPSSAGMTLGGLYLAPAIIGALCAGWLADTFYAKGYRAAPLYIMVTLLAAFIPLILCFVYAPAMELKISAMVIYYLMETMLSVLFPTVIQMATRNRIRAQISAIVLLLVNLSGYGVGPLTIALVTDHVFHDEMAIGHAMAVVCVTACGLALSILCFALKPFKQRVIAVMGDGGQTQALPYTDTPHIKVKKHELPVSP